MARKRNKRRLQTLLKAALCLPGLALSIDAFAQTAPSPAVIEVKYADYQDWQKKDEDRIRVLAPMAYFSAPIGEEWQVDGSGVVDSVSGASPLYLSTLSGASGTGIDDTRVAGEVMVTHFWDRWSLGFGGQVSDEDDYLSRGGKMQARWWTEDRNTVISLGAGFDSDQIGSTNDPSLFEKRRTGGYLLGVTQILDTVSVVQSNITRTAGNGYYSDPYTEFDNRPESREQWAWLTRYVRYFAEANGAALHVDYRIYQDTWNVFSQMLETAWYQPIGENWMVRPSLRYYTQTAADFFESTFPPQDLDQFLSFDQRMSAFGSIGMGLKIERELGKGWFLDGSMEFIQQRDDLKLGGGGTSGIASFYQRYFLFGVTRRFEP